jgi:hypothetical protein
MREPTFLDEAVLVDGEARLGLDVAAPGSRGVELGVEVQPRFARRGPARALEHEAGALARGVGGRDVDEVGVAAGFAKRVEEARRALAVELQRLVERILEGDRRGAVDDDVDVVDPLEPVVAEVARDRFDRAAVEALERRAREHLVLQALLRVIAAQQHRDGGVGQLADDLREHGLADEPGGTGEQQRLAGETVLQRRVEYLFFGQMGTVPPSLLTCQ